MNTTNGYCECGCGNTTKMSKINDPKRGYVRGELVRFIRGHHSKGRKGEMCNGWKGGVTNTSGGRIKVYNPNHPRAPGDIVHIHRSLLVIEKAIGHYLPRGLDIHHNDEDVTNDNIQNLFICNRKFHMVIHRMKKAYKACGDANWRKCWICKEYDAPENLYIRGKNSIHRSCEREYSRKLYMKGKINEGKK
ncbi:MAG: HNH endonuclease [bacterium]|nr:HNH endonuclease [bacterium]